MGVVEIGRDQAGRMILTHVGEFIKHILPFIGLLPIVAGLGPGDNFERLFVELQARTDKFHSDVQDAMKQAKQLADDIEEDNNRRVGPSFSAIGAAAVVALGNLAANAATALLGVLRQLADSAINLATNFVAMGIKTNAAMQSMGIVFTSILGDSQAALAFMQQLREQAAEIGANADQFVSVGKSLLPYAQGDIALFKQMIQLAEQLSVLNPMQGMEGAGFAVREALAGQLRSLSNRFDLPLSKLNELNVAFKKTGDVNAFIAGLQALVGQFGVTSDSIVQMSNTAVGMFNKIKFQFNDFARIFTAPIFASFQTHLGEVSQFILGNTTNWKEEFLRFGSVVAAVMDSIAEKIKDTFSGADVNNLTLTATIMKMLESLAATITLAMANLVMTIINRAILAPVNSFLVNILHAQPLVGSQAEIESYWSDEHQKELYNRMSAGWSSIFSGLGDALDASGLGDKLFPDSLMQRADEYFAQFQDLLTTPDISLGGGGQQAQQQDLSQWVDYLRTLRDTFEKYYQDIEAENKRHDDAMANLNARAAKQVSDAVVKAQKDQQKANDDYDKGREEIAVSTAKDIEQIEQDHADRIKQIRTQLEDDLFDAINARDARRVYELLRKGKQETAQANDEQRKRIIDAATKYQEDLQNLQKTRDDRLATIQDSLDEEIQTIANNLADQRQQELDNHNQRMSDLQSGLQQRLYTLARGWAEEGKITAEGINTVTQMLTAVYGPNGAYAGLLSGFNAALTAEGLIANSQLAALLGVAANTNQQILDNVHKTMDQVQAELQAAAAGLEGPNTGTGGTTTIPAPGGGGTRAFASGTDMIVRRPMRFIAGEGGRPERVTVTPQGQEGFDGGGLSDRLEMTLDVNGVSKEFESMLVDRVADITGAAINRSRKGRRH